MHFSVCDVFLIPMKLDFIFMLFFSDDDCTCLESLYDHWYPNKELDFVAFWQEVVPEWVCLSSFSHHLLQGNEISSFIVSLHFEYMSLSPLSLCFSLITFCHIL